MRSARQNQSAALGLPQGNQLPSAQYRQDFRMCHNIQSTEVSLQVQTVCVPNTAMAEAMPVVAALLATRCIRWLGSRISG